MEIRVILETLIGKTLIYSLVVGTSYCQKECAGGKTLL